MSAALRRLEGLIDVRSSYTLYHLVKTLLLLSERPQGRGHLILELGLGEASVKTLMKRLQQGRIAAKTTRGLELTQEGRRMVEAFEFSKPAEIDAGDLTLEEKDCAVLVKNAAGRIRTGLEQRDAAIKAGAEGATVLVCAEGRLAIPGVERGLEEPEKKLARLFDIKIGDVVVIGTAKNRLKAEEGAFAAVFSITNR